MAVAMAARTFDGVTYDPVKDFRRLALQMQGVIHVMKDRKWHTLDEIVAFTGSSQAGVSARLRDLRKARYGSQIIDRRHVGEGLFEYRWVR